MNQRDCSNTIWTNKFKPEITDHCSLEDSSGGELTHRNTQFHLARREFSEVTLSMASSLMLAGTTLLKNYLLQVTITMPTTDSQQTNNKPTELDHKPADFLSWEELGGSKGIVLLIHI